MKIKTMYNHLSPQNDNEISSKILPVVSLISIAGHPLFYLICRSLGNYENLIIRILASLLFIPLLNFKKNSHLFFKVYSEFACALTLPFLFSFFFYANNQNLYWKLSMVFVGGAYGLIARKVSISLFVIPLSFMLSFVASNFFIRITPIAAFYNSMTTLFSAMGCAVIMIFIKAKLKAIVSMSIEMSATQKYIDENNKLKEIAEKNLNLQRKIHTGQRLKLVAEMSNGVAREIGNALTVIKGQAFLLESTYMDNHRKEKIQTVIRIAESATVNVHQLLNFPQLGVSNENNKDLSIALIMEDKTLVSSTIKDVITIMGYSVELYASWQDYSKNHADGNYPVDLFIIDSESLNAPDNIQKGDLECLKSGKPAALIDYEGDREFLLNTYSGNKILFIDKPLDELSLSKCILQSQDENA